MWLVFNLLQCYNIYTSVININILYVFASVSLYNLSDCIKQILIIDIIR